jgi:phosphoribosylaminoimidazolecarboxamide formyltransferase/IMP cyclohydrolase
VPTALISVYDKTGVVDLARSVVSAGWRVLSSGGTAAILRDAGLPVTDVADLTGFGAILGHRVVTLHPAVHGGILADLGNPEHVADLARLGIEPISLVVVNLYPFHTNPSIELIDVGGPALVRGAAKNHAHVGVVVRPDDYARVAEAIDRDGLLSAELRRELAAVAFGVTRDYDAAIAAWLTASNDPLPDHLSLDAVKVQSLRYGENPHQHGARYRFVGASSWWDEAVQHGGKELSYLNVYDTEAAWRLVNDFADPSCVIVKHANPCGVASVAPSASSDALAPDALAEAYRRANACDPVSAFGGIVAFNGVVTVELATDLAEVFTEVVVAPGYEPEALAILTAKKNLRVLTGRAPSPLTRDVRPVDGGLLVQTADVVNLDRSTWRVVTKVQPTSELWSDIEFAWRVCAAVSSNAIVYVKDRQAFGIGAGQQNRLDSARIAAERSADRARGGVAASDAFFPFRDGLDAAAAAGIVAVVQPGGSVRDDEVIAAADEHGIAMVFTGERHFRH